MYTIDVVKNIIRNSINIKVTCMTPLGSAINTLSLAAGTTAPRDRRASCRPSPETQDVLMLVVQLFYTVCLALSDINNLFCQL